jgi:hypothetical protein
LWVCHADEAEVFVLDSGCARDLPEEHLGPVTNRILVVDRCLDMFQLCEQQKAETEKPEDRQAVTIVRQRSKIRGL